MDWLEFVNRHSIPHQPNGRHNIDVDCPWCNPGNPGRFVMTISLEGKGWHCWKQRDHRGQKATRLVQALINCSFEQAKLITGERFENRDNFMDRVSQQLQPAAITHPEPLNIPREFRKFEPQMMASAAPFVRYLIKERGFKLSTIKRLTQDYQIYWAKTGQQRFRVIFTVWQNGQLWAWTGRTITKHSLRYLATGVDDGASPITNYLLWYDELMRGGDVIALVEGPFDALKLRTLGLPATCCFTAAPSPEQAGLLHELIPRYRKCLLVLDQGTLPHAMTIRRAMPSVPVTVVELPAKYKDPAELETLDLLKTFY